MDIPEQKQPGQGILGLVPMQAQPSTAAVNILPRGAGPIEVESVVEPMLETMGEDEPEFNEVLTTAEEGKRKTRKKKKVCSSTLKMGALSVLVVLSGELSSCRGRVCGQVWKV